MTSPGDDGPRYLTLRDYLWVLRTRWYVILALTVLFGAAALGIALRQSTTYEGSASILFSDPTQGEAELLGIAPTNPQLPSQLASNAEATLAQPPTVDAARRILGIRTGGRIPGSVSAFIAPTTGYLVIQGSASSPGGAADLTNAFARAVVSLTTSASRAQFQQLAKLSLRELHALSVNDNITREVYEDRYVRLSYLAQSAAPATLIAPALPPSSPSSPHTVTDTALGLVVGLTLGILGAFLVDALDRRLRKSNEITDELGLPIIGHIREGALGTVPFASERDTEHGGLDREAFHILRRNIQLMSIERDLRSVAVTSALPEEGKSTVAASLAFANALAGKLTLLVECDLRRPAFASRLGLKRSPGLVEFLQGEATPSEIVQVIGLPTTSSNNGAASNGVSAPQAAPQPRPAQSLLACIAAGKTSVHPAELLASERFHNFLADVSAAYEMVVIDTAPLLPVADTLELLPDVDATLVCLRATRTTRDEAQALKDAIGRLPRRQIGVVITGVPHGAARGFGYYAYSYGYTSE